ncbi:hypothetical protein [Phenylobacterium montanum]|uniref:Uncharacterized protein n=1 Tax=Phenylobacterium montanum TaxID=2823693 RepID=A0A975IU94_9CAUL|nr:hypothetical protein [Caulobacter sp. S6]QUD87707.1 hypothetical protein KCG34_22105 [Caulobacter sp. S6]
MATKHKDPASDTTVRSRQRIVRGVSPRPSKRRVPLGGGPRLASGPGAFPTFAYQGGRVINQPKVWCVFLGDWSSSANQTRATRLSQFLTDLMNSDYMNMLAQYGCGSTGSVAGSVFISSSNHNLDRAAIEGVFQTAINNNTLPEPTDPSVVYVLFLDDSTGVNGTFGTDQTVMCEASSDDAFGFHFHFDTTAGNELFYAVVPGLTDTCLTNSCPDDSSCSLHLAQTREQRQTQVLSHEFSEMVTDPDVEGTEGWSGGSNPIPHENGDICNGSNGTLTVGANSWTVQQMYSKYDDQQSNGATTCVLGSSFPLPSLLPACSVILDRSTFGRDEVDAFLHGPFPQPAQFEAALYIAVDGFTANQLGITTSSFFGAPNVIPSFSFSPALGSLTITPTALSAPDQTQLDIIQRFTWTCRVTFTTDLDFPTTAGAVTPVTLTATLSGVSGSADIELVDEPNPYELDGPISWLSTDLRVFQINAGDTRFGESMGNSPADAVQFIQNVIGRLNTGNTAGDSFDAISTDETAATIELSEAVNGVPVFNFALARVRYRSLTADANNVRVFFRTFPASTTSTAYDQNSTYRRGGQGGTIIPKLGFVGGETTTIPFFASSRIDTSTQGMDAQTDPPNDQTLFHSGAGSEVIAYFGCWLDINQPSQPQFPIAPPAPVDGPYTSGRQTIQDLIRNAHQCLTCEISMDGITLLNTGDTPGSSDKLAQRNLSIVASDNPGGPASHRIPNTFEIKPSVLDLKRAGDLDELLLDWGTVPVGSVASIYMPGANAKQILNTANERYVKHRLTALDEHTLQVPAEGVTYVPIPAGSATNLAGLLTIDLPSSVRKGEVYKMVARQIGDAFGPRIEPPPVIGAPAAEAEQREQFLRWRKVKGAFQITIPVRTKETILEPEERLLGVLKWIERSIPATNRWAPVFNRYVGVVSDRVRAMGGDPDHIKPSPSGGGKTRPKHDGEERLGFVGKVDQLVYDRFGDFAGFALDTEDGMRRFASHERDMEALILRVWEERLLVKVVVEEDDLDRPMSVILLSAARLGRR